MPVTENCPLYAFSQPELKGKTAIVTGSTSGIGQLDLTAAAAPGQNRHRAA
jgi:hypothetical protein